jgi:hypothetical protein
LIFSCALLHFAGGGVEKRRPLLDSPHGLRNRVAAEEAASQKRTLEEIEFSEDSGIACSPFGCVFFPSSSEIGRMDMNVTNDFIRSEIESQNYELSLHADDERVADGLTIAQLEFVLSNCEILEQYPDDPRGESRLVLGLTPSGIPVHVVCGMSRGGRLILITVYIPSMSKWKDPHTRNR